MIAPLTAARPARDTEFTFSREEFDHIAKTLYADAGIALAEHKMPLVYGRLVKRLRALGLESFRDYCGLIGGREGADERQKMMAALTTNVTRFMREPHHFEHLRTVALPPLLEAAKRGRRVRIWSAGCSSGQEPYSIAMTLLGLLPDAADHDVRILASDIDPNMIATARAGRYSDEEMSDVAKADRTRFFEADRANGGWSVNDAMRRLIAFRELNLMGEWPMRNSFQILFCRNVVIYFDGPTQERIWGRYAAKLDPGGLLCIGHSERLSGPAKAQFDNVGPTMFTLTGRAR